MPEVTATVQVPRKLIPIFFTDKRYIVLYGGRGSAKSATAATWMAIRGYQNPGPRLVSREYQNSLSDSSFAEIKRAITREGSDGKPVYPWLKSFYDIGETYIRGGASEFIFRGLHRNTDSIKSITGLKDCWIEEGDNVSKESFLAVDPTIREPDSKIIIVLNPKNADAYIYQRFIVGNDPDALVIECNYHDNPWFPDVLERLRKSAESGDPDMYAHVWLGQLITRTDAQIFGGRWKVEEFTPGAGWDGPYDGLDFGFSNDPTAGVRVWIQGRRLCIEHECGRVGLELDDTAKYMKSGMPWDRNLIRADSARPESISYLQRNGLPGIVACKKGPGSVESGIRHMRSYEIIVHPRCVETARELRLYSYKVDRLSGDVTSTIIDAHNHYIDAIRYAIEPIMLAGGSYFGQPSAAVVGAGTGFGNNLI